MAEGIDEFQELELLKELHRDLVRTARELLAKGEWALALSMIKHNNITAPRRADSGTMDDAGKVASKLDFRPRQRLQAVPPPKRSTG